MEKHSQVFMTEDDKFQPFTLSGEFDEKHERQLVIDAIEEEFGGPPHAEADHGISKIIFTDYCTDFPDFAGKIALVLFGCGVEFSLIYARNVSDNFYKRLTLFDPSEC